MSEHADRVLAAIEADDDTSALVASWRRCHRVHALHPDRVDVPHRDLVRWTEACERDAQLVAVAQPYMDELFRLMADVDCGVFLVDREAMVLDMRTNRPHDSFGRPPDQCLGTYFSERFVGTNSMGTGVAEQRTLVLRGDSHFLAHYTNYVCISAPLFGPDGTLVGALVINHNVAAHASRLDPFFAISVSSFTHRIESEMFARAFPNTRTVLASPVGRRPDALLAVDADDRVVGATHAARRLFALPDRSAPSVGLEQLLEEHKPAQLADMERRAIERALSRFDGNVSAAAKAMGISRSTFYRKLARYAHVTDSLPILVR